MAISALIATLALVVASVDLVVALLALVVAIAEFRAQRRIPRYAAGNRRLPGKLKRENCGGCRQGRATTAAVRCHRGQPCCDEVQP